MDSPVRHGSYKNLHNKFSTSFPDYIHISVENRIIISDHKNVIIQIVNGACKGGVILYKYEGKQKLHSREAQSSVPINFLLQSVKFGGFYGGF